MADATNESPTPESAATSESQPGDGRLARIVHWASASKLRMALVGSVLFASMGGVFATWSYLAHLAVNHEDQYTLARALEALDEKDYSKAKNIIGEMQQRGTDPEEFGGALFVLGAVKAALAEQEWSRDRQRAMHLIAARYLQKARELGVPERLENTSRLMVGQSLVRGNQPQTGIEVLKKLLADDDESTTKIHKLLAEAYQSIPEPNWSAALEHNQAVLADEQLDPASRNAASIAQADILGRMGRLEEAGKFLEFAGSSDAQQALISTISGRIAIEQANRLPRGSEERAILAKRARDYLQQSLQLDPLNSMLTRQAKYWIGKSFEVDGNHEAAIQRYDHLNKAYGDTPESIAAMLAKADLARANQDTEQALIGYREVLSTVGEPVTYVNRLLPLSTLRKRLLNAHRDFVDRQQYAEAMALVDSLQPVFSLTDATELRAQSHQQWAESLLERAASAPHWDAAEYRTQARYHYRAAGAAYELLSKLRYASRSFIDDLWRAGENYFLGHSYSHTQRVLEDYLRQEAQKRQALALLRLGQSQLALGEYAKTIDTLTECIEMHPKDATVYQARLECAHAHLQLDQGNLAEQLLRDNIVGGSLEPSATEWLDSLFLLGNYWHDSQRYQESIQTLDEAVLRHEKTDKTTRDSHNAEQAMLARYTIARSFHSAADKPAKLAQEAKTESERQKNRKLRDDNLNSALENYLHVQRMLTLQGNVDSNELDRMLLRNCYMMQGSVLYQLKRYEEARKAYANISTLYQNEPFVLESFVHIANCYRKLNKPVKAKGTIEQAKLVLNRLPSDTDFKLATNFSRQSWELLLNEMSGW
ncbi:MAG: tetratricopeptide repeat protein [Planctomycetota bacterium]